MTGDTESYAENTALTKLAGDHPKTRILIALLAEPTGRCLNKSEIATQAGLSRTTVHDHLDDLATLGGDGADANAPISKVPSTDGHPVYRLNTDCPAAKRLARLEWDAIDLVAAERQA